jgi:hypothetical protein
MAAKSKVGKLARKVKGLIKVNRLSTPEKYNAFRKAHPELDLPSAGSVMFRYERKGWNW